MITKRIVFTALIMFVALFSVSAQEIMQKNSMELSQILGKDKKIVILDVRTPQEFVAGHLTKAINIDYYNDDFYSRIDKLDKKLTYLIYCRTSNRSGNVVKYMNQNGFKNLYQMTDGFSGWALNNLPFVK